MRVLELADKLRDRGLNVVEVADWQTRGRPFSVRPDICIRHWTAGSTRGATPSLRIVTHGRRGLRGPLCQLYQSREPDGDDIIYVIASGVANHAGRGEWAGVSGNSRSMGLEIEWSGPDEVFSEARKAISEQAMAAMMNCALGTNPNDACEHREYAKPAGRKIDTNLSGDELRQRMAVLMNEIDDPAPVTHTVGEGESLPEIAAAYHVSIERIVELNPRLIAVGDELRIV